MTVLTYIMITLGVFLAMEAVTWLTHKYVMHGLGWYFHEDHHQPGYPHVFEKNDFFFVVFAIPSIALFYFGTANGINWLFFVGLGILLYGICYFLVHDVLIHRRFKWFDKTNNWYFRGLRKAHKMHHKHLGKEDGECFGMLFVPFKYFREARASGQKNIDFGTLLLSFLNIASFIIPFVFSFEKKWMHFIRFWKPYFSAIIVVGLFFILWDIYFAYQNVWGFNNQYLVGFYLFKLPVEEWLFFLLIPYSSNFIHYSLEYFFPKLMLPEKVSSIITVLLLIIAFTITVLNFDKTYTVVNFGVFSVLMMLQLIYKWSYIRRFYLSFIIIYIVFFLVNSALTGSFSENPVVFYDNAENLGIRIGTMPLEDSFYCFSMLYSSVVIFEILRRKWGYCLSMDYSKCK